MRLKIRPEEVLEAVSLYLASKYPTLDKVDPKDMTIQVAQASIHGNDAAFEGVEFEMPKEAS